MRKLFPALLLLLWAASAAADAAPSVPAAPKHRDVRVLIDVSGSMKHNDPKNLRAPALRLLVNLLPKGTHAGVWSFAQYVNPLVPEGEVSNDWQRAGTQAAGRIHSRGLFTDIGKALAVATKGWEEKDPNTARHLILLTDGMVDVSKTPGANEKARRDILEKRLPLLRDAGVTIHTIALSGNADKKLLRRLAQETDGDFEEADSADELQKIFLKLFEKSVPRNTLPLEGNKFQVDSSVHELTVLAFRKSDATPTRLTPPNGKTYGKSDAPTGVRWLSQAGYDLITVPNPTPGEWHLVADMDPNNRVMVVTDLRLDVSALPNNLLAGERIPLRIALSQKKARITREDFLKLLTVSVLQSGPGDHNMAWQLQDNGLGDDKTGGDGVYSLNLGQGLESGTYSVLVHVDGKTFQRERRQTIRVYPSPVAVRREPLAAQDGLKRSIRVSTALAWLNKASMKVGATITNPDGTTEAVTMPAAAEGLWRLDLNTLDPHQAYGLRLEVAGETDSGRSFQTTLPDIRLPAAVKTVSQSSTAPPPKQTEAAAKPHPEKQDKKPEPKPAANHDKKPGVNWVVVSILVVTFNLVLVALAGLAFYLIRMRRANRPGFSNDDAEEKVGATGNEG